MDQSEVDAIEEALGIHLADEIKTFFLDARHYQKMMNARSGRLFSASEVLRFICAFDTPESALHLLPFWADGADEALVYVDGSRKGKNL